MSATTQVNIDAETPFPGSTGSVYNANAPNRIMPAFKKIAVPAGAGVYNVSSTFHVRSITCNADGIISLKVRFDDSFDNVQFIAGVDRPYDVIAIDRDATTATGIIIWG